MRTNFFAGVAFAALVIPAAAHAQETTSSIRGTVVANGAPVAGAEVTVTHVPSGSRSTTTTSDDGSFTASGLRAGGPYTVEVSSDSGQASVTDVYTVLGQAYTLPIDLAANDSGNEIVVTASAIVGAGSRSDGPQTVMTRADISKVASINRDVRDLERRDPFATLDLTNSRAVSFAGVNPRFNRFSVDGVAVSDNFGLNPDASPTGRGPIPFDAISQFSVSVAPYDIRQGNFQGGAINSVLLSGTNKFHGTGFYSVSSDNLQGRDVAGVHFTLPSYLSKTYGATISGPILKDKLFFMVSAERNVDPRPLTPNSIAQIPGLNTPAGATALAGIISTASSKYHYTTGDILTITPNKDEKVVGKIDWNISDTQRLALTYINAYDTTTLNQNSSTSTSSPSIGLASNGYVLSELLRSGVIELNSDWSDKLSTEVRGVYKKYVRGQDPVLGRGFAQFQVCLDPNATTTFAGTANTSSLTSCSTGTPRVTFGPDISRQSNAFNTDTYSGSLLLRYVAGAHEIKGLFEYDETSIFNLFLQNSAGAYYFDNVADFVAGKANSLTYQDAVSLNTNDAAATFKYQQYVFGIQDEWRVSPDLTVDIGARYDLFGSHSPVPLNPNFVARYGFPNTKTYKGLGILQPRVSFNFNATPTLDLRGGVGIFAGGTPDVYISNSYSNTGYVTNQISVNRTATGYSVSSIGSAALDNVTGTSFASSVQQYLATNLGSLASAPTNAIDPNYEIPNVLKATLSAEWHPEFLGGGWTFGADYYFSKTRAAPQFVDIRSVPGGTLPDGRTRYKALNGDTSGNYDILLRSTDLGRSHIGVVRFDKKFDFGVSLGASFTYQNVKDASPATSSTATSNYSNGAFDDPNFTGYGTSNDETRWAVKYNLGFDHAFFEDYRTVFQLFGETRAGRPYSFTMQDTTLSNTVRSQVFGVMRTPNDRFLMYVPTSTTDALVSYDSTATRDKLDALINSTALKDYRGKVAGRNIGRSPTFTRIDLHLEQEIPTFVGKSRITLFGDIENLPNLINSKWGGLRQAGFPYVEDVVRVQCLQTAVATGTTPTSGQISTSAATPCTQYRYSSYADPNDQSLSVSNSLYLIRVGARFTF